MTFFSSPYPSFRPSTDIYPYNNTRICTIPCTHYDSLIITSTRDIIMIVIHICYVVWLLTYSCYYVLVLLFALHFFLLLYCYCFYIRFWLVYCKTWWFWMRKWEKKKKLFLPNRIGVWALLYVRR